MEKKTIVIISIIATIVIVSIILALYYTGVFDSSSSQDKQKPVVASKNKEVATVSYNQEVLNKQTSAVPGTIMMIELQTVTPGKDFYLALLPSNDLKKPAISIGTFQTPQVVPFIVPLDVYSERAIIVGYELDPENDVITNVNTGIINTDLVTYSSDTFAIKPSIEFSEDSAGMVKDADYKNAKQLGLKLLATGLSSSSLANAGFVLYISADNKVTWRVAENTNPSNTNFVWAVPSTLESEETVWFKVKTTKLTSLGNKYYQGGELEATVMYGSKLKPQPKPVLVVEPPAPMFRDLTVTTNNTTTVTFQWNLLKVFPGVTYKLSYTTWIGTLLGATYKVLATGLTSTSHTVNVPIVDFNALSSFYITFRVQTDQSDNYGFSSVTNNIEDLKPLVLPAPIPAQLDKTLKGLSVSHILVADTTGNNVSVVWDVNDAKNTSDLLKIGYTSDKTALSSGTILASGVGVGLKYAKVKYTGSISGTVWFFVRNGDNQDFIAGSLDSSLFAPPVLPAPPAETNRLTDLRVLSVPDKKTINLTYGWSGSNVDLTVTYSLDAYGNSPVTVTTVNTSQSTVACISADWTAVSTSYLYFTLSSSTGLHKASVAVDITKYNIIAAVAPVVNSKPVIISEFTVRAFSGRNDDIYNSSSNAQFYWKIENALTNTTLRIEWSKTSTGPFQTFQSNIPASPSYLTASMASITASLSDLTAQDIYFKILTTDGTSYTVINAIKVGGTWSIDTGTTINRTCKAVIDIPIKIDYINGDENKEWFNTGNWSMYMQYADSSRDNLKDICRVSIVPLSGTDAVILLSLRPDKQFKPFLPCETLLHTNLCGVSQTTNVNIYLKWTNDTTERRVPINYSLVTASLQSQENVKISEIKINNSTVSNATIVSSDIPCVLTPVFSSGESNLTSFLAWYLVFGSTTQLIGFSTPEVKSFTGYLKPNQIITQNCTIVCKILSLIDDKEFSYPESPVPFTIQPTFQISLNSTPKVYVEEPIGPLAIQNGHIFTMINTLGVKMQHKLEYQIDGQTTWTNFPQSISGNPGYNISSTVNGVTLTIIPDAGLAGKTVAFQLSTTNIDKVLGISSQLQLLLSQLFSISYDDTKSTTRITIYSSNNANMSSYNPGERVFLRLPSSVSVFPESYEVYARHSAALNWSLVFRNTYNQGLVRMKIPYSSSIAAGTPMTTILGSLTGNLSIDVVTDTYTAGDSNNPPYRFSEDYMWYSFFGYIYLTAGTYNFIIDCDDQGGFQIRVSGSLLIASTWAGAHPMLAYMTASSIPNIYGNPTTVDIVIPADGYYEVVINSVESVGAEGVQINYKNFTKGETQFTPVPTSKWFYKPTQLNPPAILNTGMYKDTAVDIRSVSVLTPSINNITDLQYMLVDLDRSNTTTVYLSNQVSVTQAFFVRVANTIEQAVVPGLDQYWYVFLNMYIPPNTSVSDWTNPQRWTLAVYKTSNTTADTSVDKQVTMKYANISAPNASGFSDMVLVFDNPEEGKLSASKTITTLNYYMVFSYAGFSGKVTTTNPSKLKCNYAFYTDNEFIPHINNIACRSWYAYDAITGKWQVRQCKDPLTVQCNTTGAVKANGFWDSAGRVVNQHCECKYADYTSTLTLQPSRLGFFGSKCDRRIMHGNIVMASRYSHYHFVLVAGKTCSSEHVILKDGLNFKWNGSFWENMPIGLREDPSNYHNAVLAVRIDPTNVSRLPWLHHKSAIWAWDNHLKVVYLVANPRIRMYVRAFPFMQDDDNRFPRNLSDQADVNEGYLNFRSRMNGAEILRWYDDSQIVMSQVQDWQSPPGSRENEPWPCSDDGYWYKTMDQWFEFWGDGPRSLVGGNTTANTAHGTGTVADTSNGQSIEFSRGTLYDGANRMLSSRMVQFIDWLTDPGLPIKPQYPPLWGIGFDLENKDVSYGEVTRIRTRTWEAGAGQWETLFIPVGKDGGSDYMRRESELKTGMMVDGFKVTNPTGPIVGYTGKETRNGRPLGFVYATPARDSKTITQGSDPWYYDY